MTMKSLVSCVFVAVGVVTATPGHVLSGFGGPSPAPQRFDSDDWCRQQNWGNDRAGVCEVRELTFASAGKFYLLAVEPHCSGRRWKVHSRVRTAKQR